MIRRAHRNMVRYRTTTFLIGKKKKKKKPSSKFQIFLFFFYSIRFRNGRDHVQPFVLVQFKNLPYERLVSVTCRLWYPGVEHETRTMRSMVTFQLYRTHSEEKTVNEHVEE